jgi:hypothetical protein
MTHAQLVRKAVTWLRSYRCSVVLSEQACASGEVPDAIGWKKSQHSVVVECKVSRGDFLADRGKPFRQRPETAVGCERFYMTAPNLIRVEELPPGWGLLECKGGQVVMRQTSSPRSLRSAQGLKYEMNLLLASLRRVELRVEPQTITEFLKWKNRLAVYNGGMLPAGVTAPEREQNLYLSEDEELIPPASSA